MPSFQNRVKRGAHKNDTLDEEITLSSMYAGLLGTTGPDANKDGGLIITGLIITSRVSMKSKLLKRTGDVLNSNFLTRERFLCSFSFCHSVGAQKEKEGSESYIRQRAHPEIHSQSLCRCLRCQLRPGRKLAGVDEAQPMENAVKKNGRVYQFHPARDTSSAPNSRNWQQQRKVRGQEGREVGYILFVSCDAHHIIFFKMG